MTLEKMKCKKKQKNMRLLHSMISYIAFLASLTRIYIFLANQEDEKLHRIQALHPHDLFDADESLDLVIKYKKYIGL